MGVSVSALRVRLDEGKRRWGATAVWLAVAYTVVAAAGRWIYAIPRLVTDAAPWSALDLGYRYEEVQRWFGGLDVYHTLERLLYPPASYVVLWPFLGWLPFSSARWLWSATTLLACGLLALIAYRVGDPLPRRERLAVALLAFAAFPIQISLFVGQLPVHAIAFAAGAAWLLCAPRPRWARDVAGAVLLAASLVKPTLTAPVAVATLIGSGRWRPAVLAGAAYVVFAVGAAAVQPDGIVSLHAAWLASTSTPSLIEEGLPNLHLWLAQIGLHGWATAASIVVLLAFTAWAWLHRRADPWLLIAAAAVVARFWTYHREYDDAVLLLVAIGLLRVWSSRHAWRAPAAGLFLALTWLALLTPTWAIYDLPRGVVLTIQWAHAVLWLAIFAFLVSLAARRARPTSVSTDEPTVRPAAVGAR